MNPAEHEKRRLPRAVVLEKRNYIRFRREPVIDKGRVLVTDAEVKNRYHAGVYRPWIDT